MKHDIIERGDKMLKTSKRIQKEMMKKKNSKYFYILLVLFIGFVLYEDSLQLNTLESSQVVLTKCVDGDTAHFEINGVDETVRFLAIDTPELEVKGKSPEPYANEAANYTCKALKEATSIKLEYEEEKYDKYDRRLAWVFVDDELLQEKIVEEGFAKVRYLYDDYKYTKVVEDAEKIAQQEKKGVWSIENINK